jgi:ABC-2 type transport system permease protein
VAASLGVLIGSLTSSPEKTTGICVLTAIMMAALGGCWWPMEVVPDSLKLVGHIFPTAWTMDALHQLISFGGGLPEIDHELGVLLGFAAGTNFLAGWFLKW